LQEIAEISSHLRETTLTNEQLMQLMQKETEKTCPIEDKLFLLKQCSELKKTNTNLITKNDILEGEVFNLRNALV
jgi:hypothetical protein